MGANVGKPQVAYRETIAETAKAGGRNSFVKALARANTVSAGLRSLRVKEVRALKFCCLWCEALTQGVP